MTVLLVGIAPVLMIVASLLEHRVGAAAAGLIAAAPVAVLVGILVVTSDQGLRAGTALAASCAAHVSAQVVYAVVVAAAARRLPLVSALLLGAAVYVGGAVVLAVVPSSVAVALALVALIGGRVLIGEAPAPEESAGPTGSLIALRAGVATLAVGAVLVACRLAGPTLAGTIGAFPTFTTCLALLVYAARGIAGLRGILVGLVRALPANLAFCLTYWTVAGSVGTPMGLALSVVACGLTYSALATDPLGRLGAHVRGASRVREAAGCPAVPSERARASSSTGRAADF